MKVVFLTHAIGNGGTERMICRLSNAFVQRGMEVTILVINANNPTYELDKAVRILYIGEGKKSKAERLVHALFVMHDFFKREKIDILLCFITTTIPIAVLSGAGMKRKYKIIGAERSNPTVMNYFHKKIVSIFLKYCDGFVFQTKGAQKMYPPEIQKKSVVIGNIVPDMSKEKVSGRGTMPYGICSSGRLHSDKDFVTVIKAFEKVIQIEPRATLHIYGDGPDKEMLEQQCKNANVEHSVFFEGFSDDMIGELRRYEIFVFSSRAEGMPNALMEAMAAGLACISTDCKFGPSELIDNGQNGYLVEVGDSTDMADKMTALLRDFDKRKRMGNAAEVIRTEYSENIVVQQYMDYFEQLMCRGL